MRPPEATAGWRPSGSASPRSSCWRNPAVGPGEAGQDVHLGVLLAERLRWVIQLPAPPPAVPRAFSGPRLAPPISDTAETATIPGTSPGSTCSGFRSSNRPGTSAGSRAGGAAGRPRHRPPGEMGQWIKDLAAAHRTSAERLANLQNLTIPSQDPDYGDLGQAFPPWPGSGRDAILRPPKPEIRPSLSGPRTRRGPRCQLGSRRLTAARVHPGPRRSVSAAGPRCDVAAPAVHGDDLAGSRSSTMARRTVTRATPYWSASSASLGNRVSGANQDGRAEPGQLRCTHPCLGVGRGCRPRSQKVSVPIRPREGARGHRQRACLRDDNPDADRGDRKRAAQCRTVGPRNGPHSLFEVFDSSV